jgi:excisionase family DNA binding protein
MRYDLEIHMNNNPEYTFKKRALKVDEFCENYGLGRTRAYQEIKEGRLKSVTIGARRLIKFDDAETWLAGLSSNTPQQQAA